MTMTDSITELFEELVADGNDADDLQAFIDKYGKSEFSDYIEEYLQAIDESSEEAVESFLEIFSIEDIGYFTDAYQGQWDSGAEFAQNLAEDCCEVPRDMSGWIEIDWEKSWDNLSYDYVECGEGHIFSQNY